MSRTELQELKAAIRDFQRVDIVLSRCSVDELAEIIDTANNLFSGLPLRWVAGVVSKELDRREREGSEPGLLRLPVHRFSVQELCGFNQALRVWLRREPNPNIQDFLQQAFAIALGNLSSRFQILQEAYGE